MNKENIIRIRNIFLDITEEPTVINSRAVSNSTNSFVWTNNNAIMNENRAAHGSCGAINNILVTAGCTDNILNPPIVNTTEIFNGNVWTNSISMNNARSSHTTVGVYNNALSISGGKGSNQILEINEKFDGNVWSNSISMNIPRFVHGACGVSNNTLVSGGSNDDNGTFINSTEKFNGTAWINKGDMNTTRGFHGCTGTSNNAIVIAGLDNSTNVLNSTESYDNTAWSINASFINTARLSYGTSGISNNALISGGFIVPDNSMPYLDSTEKFNGTTWFNKSNMNSKRSSNSTCGASNKALTTGGSSEFDCACLNTTEMYAIVTTPPNPDSGGGDGTITPTPPDTNINNKGMVLTIIGDNDFIYNNIDCLFKWDDDNEVLSIIKTNNDKYTQMDTPIRVINLEYDNIQYISLLYKNNDSLISALNKFGVPDTHKTEILKFANSITNFIAAPNINIY